MRCRILRIFVLSNVNESRTVRLWFIHSLFRCWISIIEPSHLIRHNRSRERDTVRDNGCIHLRRGSKISPLHQEIEPFCEGLKKGRPQPYQFTWFAKFETQFQNGSRNPHSGTSICSFLPVITFTISHNFPLSLNSLANPIIQSNCLHFSDSSTLSSSCIVSERFE